MNPGRWSGRFGHGDTRSLIGANQRRLFPACLREKRWCYAGIFTPELIFGCAVIHLGYLCSGFVFGFNRKKKHVTEHTFIFPPLGQVTFDRNPETGSCQYRSFSGRIQLLNVLDLESSKLHINVKSGKKRLRADVELRAPESGFEPMHFLMPMIDDQKAFTAKAAGISARGQIQINDKTYLLEPSTASAVVDWTNGFYPRQTFWNWACGSGTCDSGHWIGFNFSSGVYEYGLLENTVWINGKPLNIGPVEFIYDHQNPDRPWTIKSQDNTVNLCFYPEGFRKANDNLGIIKSRFIQGVGAFKGKIKSRTATFNVDHIPGVTEEHFAVW